VKTSDTAPAQNSPAGKTADVNLGLQGPPPLSAHNYWHFVDMPVPKGSGPAPQWSNAEEKIQSLAADLKSPKTTPDQKAYALAWLIHLVGDVHQPLHASEQYQGFGRQGDEGGNLVFICPANAADCGMTTLCPNPRQRCSVGNLHSYWDGLPGESTSVKSAIRAAKLLKPADAKAASIADVHAWVMESNQLAIDKAYAYPIKLGSQGAFKLTAAYKADAEKVAASQIPLAGARLKNLLNAALSAPMAGC
jgi:hypothetical protein